jgi:serine/threonine-protein kinase
MHPEPQLLAGRYRLDHPLAAGGMADVWRATDQVLHRPVAVKVIRPGLLAQPGFAERFAAEARILAGLHHPGIVGVHDYGEEAGSAFLVMDFIDGEALSDRLAREGPIGAAPTMQIIAQAAEALQAAHEAGVVHRDIKPANVLIRPDGTVVIVDFGVAKAPVSAGLTQTNTVMGTARYMSPEQVTGRAVTATSDLYALGAVAYECLTGTPPFDADSPVALALKHVSEEPPPLPPTVPPAVAAVVDRAMAKEPADRFPDAAALAAAARAAAARPDATAVLPVTTVPSGRRRGGYALIGGAVVAVMIGILLIATSLPSNETPLGPQPSISSGTRGSLPPRAKSPGATVSGPTAGPAVSGSAQPAATGTSPSPRPPSSPSPKPPPSPSPQPVSSITSGDASPAALAASPS